MLKVSPYIITFILGVKLALLSVLTMLLSALSLAECLAEKSNDYLPGFVLKEYSAEQINNVIKFDTSDPK